MVRTEMLYMDDVEGNYIREFSAVVARSGDGYVVLDRTVFYPEGGGQPSDRGTLEWDDGTARVTKVTKSGIVKHYIDVDEPIREGTAVRGTIDWDLRHSHMRMHTAQHILSGVAYDLFGARTRGNQIKAAGSRLDLGPLENDPAVIKRIEDGANDVVMKNIPLSIREVERTALLERTDPMRSNLDLIPSSIKVLRVVEIPGFDVCPCAGTHVRNTGEIGRIRVTRTENKGKGTVRIRYVLDGPDE